MIEVIIKKSMKRDKTYDAIIKNNNDIKTISFGQDGASDYTMHKDSKRKQLYIKRHEKREESRWTFSIDNILYPSFYSRWITWEMKTIEEAVKELNKKYTTVKFKYEK